MKKTIGLIGAGNMGGAIMKGIASRFQIFVCEKDRPKLTRLRRKIKMNPVALENVLSCADTVILAVKPQDSEEVLHVLRPSWAKDKLLISIAAGLTTGYLEQKLGGQARVVRTMPNMPALIGEGMTAIAKGRYCLGGDTKLAAEIFRSLGQTIMVPEKNMDAVTAVSGSGPAYVFLFAECLLAAARKLGLDSRLSQELVLTTLKGSVALWEQSEEDPGVLRERVTSKGGTTQAALAVFSARQLGEIFNEALLAAKQRAGELAK